MRTPKNILRHELIGLECEVADASNKCQIGLKGKIVDETRKTITLETTKGCKKIAKQNTTFRLKLNKHTVEISGNDIIARPEDRIKKKFKKW